MQYLKQILRTWLYDRGLYYSLFHQILGVVSLYIFWLLFKILCKFFVGSYFHLPNIPENLVKLCRIFSRLDNLACNNIISK